MIFTEIDKLIDRAGPQTVVEFLAPMIADQRRKRIEEVLHGRLASIEVASERPDDPHNAAAIVRTSEALGVMRVHVIDAGPRALDHRWVTQGATHWVHTHEHDDFGTFMRDLATRGARLFGAVMHGTLSMDELPVDRPICVIFGNEGMGLTDRALYACDDTFRVPMFGMSESLNLSVSAAITLQSLVRRRRAIIGSSGELRGLAYLREKARYYARCVEMRILEARFG